MTHAPAASPAPPQVLLAHHLKQLKLPTFLREYEKVAAEAAREGLDHPRYLLAPGRTRTDRPRAPHGRTAHPRRPVPGGEEPRHFDFTAMPAQQAAGPGAGALRIHRRPRQHHRARQQRHRQDPLALAWVWPPASAASRSPSRPPPGSSTSSWRPRRAPAAAAAAHWPRSNC